MSTLTKIGAALAAFVVLAALALVVFLATFDVEAYRERIANAATEATGRRLDLAGAMELELGLRPTLVIEDVRFGNAPWGSQPEMARLERLEVQLELLPLLTGEIRVNRLLLIAPEILLETRDDGEPNWVLDPPDPPSSAPAQGEPVEGSGVPAIPLFEKVRLERATLVHAGGGERRTLTLEELTASATSIDGPLEIALRGRWRDTDAELSGTLAPLAAIVDRSRPLAIDVAGAVSPLGELALATRLEGDPGTQIRLEELRLRIGSSSVAGRLEAELGGERPRLRASLRSDRLAAPGASPAHAPPSPVAAEGAPRDKVLPRDTLPFEALRSVDTEIDLAVGEVDLATGPLRELTVGARLEGGRLRVEPLAVRFAGSHLRGAIEIDASRPLPEVALRLDAEDLQVESLLGDGTANRVRGGNADLSVRLRGRGDSIAAIAATLDGETRLLVDAMEARTGSLDVAVGGLSRVLGTLFQGDEEWTTIHCAASNLSFRQGVATPEVLLVDTEFSTFVAAGRIDLREETLDLVVTPSPKETTLSLAVPVKIGGTLAQPTARPDELAAAKKIGGLLSIAVFPPAALASLAELGSNDNVCLTLAAGGRPPARRGVTTAAKDAGKQVVEGIGSGARKVGEGLKGLFGD